MAVSSEVFEQLKGQLQDWPQAGGKTAPPPPSAIPASDLIFGAEPTRAESGWNLGESLKKSAQEVGSAVGMGAIRGADFLKGVAAGTVMPLIPEGGEAGVQGPIAKTVWSMLKPSEDIARPEAIKAADDPQTVLGKVLNPAGKGVGAMATMPIPGAGILRTIVAGTGMGEGAEIGKHILGGIANYFDPAWRRAGEATGEILGGGIGAQANVTRMRAAGELLSRPIELIKNIKPAYDAARSAQQAGDQRQLWQIFADEFGNLRATTKGLIEQYTNAELASALRRDINALPQAKQFMEDANLAGIKEDVTLPTGEVVKPWGLGERTMVPTITQISRERVPKTFAEGTEVSALVQGRQKAIADAYNRLAGEKPPGNEDGAVAAAKVFQKITQAKVDALTSEQDVVKSKFPDLTSRSQFALGETVRAERDALAKQSFDVASAKYAQAEALHNAEGSLANLSGVRSAGTKILDEFIAGMDPAQVPTVVKNLVRGGEDKLFVNLKDANELSRTLNRMMGEYKSTERWAEYGNAKKMLGEVQQAINAMPASAEAKAAYREAQRYWAEEHAPRFMEGLGKALGRERGGVFEGREALEGQKVMDNALQSETAMRDWERLFGNDSTAKTALRGALEGRYREVLNTTKTPDALEKATYEFNRKYASALERFPEAASKIDDQSAKMMAVMREREREIARYKDIMDGPVAQSVGPIQAKTMYQNALTDPLVMDKLLRAMPANKGNAAQKMVKELWLQANPMKSGEYDASALYDILQAGKRNEAMQSSMEKLFETAFGKEGGQQHMARLEAIASFAQREAATNPRVLRPGRMFAEEPVKEATGQSLASWISAWRAQKVGATGSSFFTLLGLSRFANAKAQAAVEAAKLKALYDPETAKAVLEMAGTPSSQPIGISTARKIFGDITLADGQKLVDRLLDRGFIAKYLTRGALYGAEKAVQEK